MLASTVLLCALASFAAEAAGLPPDVAAALSKAKSVEPYSLEPGEKADGGKALHGWKVLGKTTLSGANAERAVEAIRAAVGVAGGAKCFEPRHAARVTRDGKTIDLVICFACSWVYVYRGETRAERLQIGKAPESHLDKILEGAKVPLSRKGEK